MTNQRKNFEAFKLRRNPKYQPSDDSVRDRLDWELWIAALAQPVQPDWISVADRVPADENSTVIVVDRYGAVGAGQLDDEGRLWECSFLIIDGTGDGYITHWTPFPPPPEATK